MMRDTKRNVNFAGSDPPMRMGKPFRRVRSVSNPALHLSYTRTKLGGSMFYRNNRRLLSCYWPGWVS